MNDTASNQLSVISREQFKRGGVNWYSLLDSLLLTMLDDFFRRVSLDGGRAFISPHPESLGRMTGSPTSQHFLLRAADVMVEGITLQRAYEIAKDVGFTGIGLYPDTKPSPMIHLDTRRDRTAANPAKWARIGQEYTGIEAALV